MENFLEFIKGDIIAKKTYLSTLPKTTKANIRKLNENVDDMLQKYDQYKSCVKKYIEVKSSSFELPNTKEDVTELNNKIKDIEDVKVILNPLNTFFEKMGLDNLLYKIDNYDEFNFNSLSEVINEFLNVFEIAGIKLTKEDFKYTSYVNQYMSEFIDRRENRVNNSDKLSQTFESIYWENPELIHHIELNFRYLAKKYKKEFNKYLDIKQKEIVNKYQIKTYKDCIEELNKLKEELKIKTKEDIFDIITLAKKGNIDTNSYFEDSKVRQTLYNTIVINPVDYNNSKEKEKFYSTINKLEISLDEYSHYLDIVPLVTDFKNLYVKEISLDKKGLDAKLKDLEKQLNEKENKLEKTNNKIFGGKFNLFKKDESEIKQLKMNSILQANEIYKLYQDYQNEYFRVKILSTLNKFSTISDLLNIYYSYDYYKKSSIKKVLKLTEYDQIIEFNDRIKMFINSTNNIIMSSTPLFEDEETDKIIVNRYRLENINIAVDNLEEDSLKQMLDNIKMLIRIYTIENSESSIEKVWFIGEIEKIKRNDSK